MRILLITLLTAMFCQSAYAAKTLDQVLAEVRENKRGDKARTHITDPYRVDRLKKRDEQKAVVTKSCQSIKNGYKRFNCFNDGMDKWSKENPDRGTKEYGDKFYANLDKVTAKSKLKELISLMDYVSFNPSSIDNKDTELTVDLLHSETMYIERYVLKVNPKDHRPFK